MKLMKVIGEDPGDVGRSPCGERGLKWEQRRAAMEKKRSLPVRGAWIEIIRAYPHGTTCPVAPRAGSVD